jgi:glycosyltransferase involved in cell wall biosynthesis
VRIYWYQPYPHTTASEMAKAVIRPGDELTVQTLSSYHGVSAPPIDDYQTIRDLPDPVPARSSPLVRRLTPLSATLQRHSRRRRALRKPFEIAHLSLLTYRSDWIDVPSLAGRLPLVSNVHDVRPHESRLPGLVVKRTLRHLYRRAGHLIVYHQVLAEELVADFGVDPAFVHVIPHRVKPVQMRQESSEAGEPMTMLLFGSLRANKGIHVLLDAAQQLGSEVPFRILIAGAASRQMANHLQERASELPHVDLEFGRITPDRKHQLFSRSSVILLPYTEFHSQSGVLFDAYAYGLPVIASDVGAVGPTVREENTGIVIPPRDPEALAMAMLSVGTGNPDAFADHVSAAIKSHSYATLGPQLRAVYDQVLG